MDIEVNNLILGYLKNNNFSRAAREFEFESHYVKKKHLASQFIGKEYLVTNLNKIIQDYCAMKKAENELIQRGEASCILSLWGQFDAIVNQLKILTIGKQNAQTGQKSRARSLSNTNYQRVFARVASSQSMQNVEPFARIEHAVSNAANDFVTDPDCRQQNASIKSRGLETSLNQVTSQMPVDTTPPEAAHADVTLSQPLEGIPLMDDLTKICPKSPKRKRIRPKKLESNAQCLQTSTEMQNHESQRYENTGLPGQTNPFSVELNAIFDALLNSKCLQEKIADNINKVATSSTSLPVISHETHGNELVNSLPSIDVEEVLNITRTDPSFESLFAVLDDTETSLSAIQTPRKPVNSEEALSSPFEPIQDGTFISEQVEELNSNEELIQNSKSNNQSEGFAKIEDCGIVKNGASSRKPSRKSNEDTRLSNNSSDTVPDFTPQRFQTLQSNPICNIYIKKKKSVKRGTWKPLSFRTNKAVLTGSGSMSRARLNQTFKDPCSDGKLSPNQSEVDRTGAKSKVKKEGRMKIRADSKDEVVKENENNRSVMKFEDRPVGDSSLREDRIEFLSARDSGGVLNDTKDISPQSEIAGTLTADAKSISNGYGPICTDVRNPYTDENPDRTNGRLVRFDLQPKGLLDVAESGNKADGIEQSGLVSAITEHMTQHRKKSPRKRIPRKSILKNIFGDSESCRTDIGYVQTDVTSDFWNVQASKPGVDVYESKSEIRQGVKDYKEIELNEVSTYSKDSMQCLDKLIDLECKEKVDFIQAGDLQRRYDGIVEEALPGVSNNVGIYHDDRSGNFGAPTSSLVDNRIEYKVKDLKMSENQMLSMVGVSGSLCENVMFKNSGKNKQELMAEQSNEMTLLTEPSNCKINAKLGKNGDGSPSHSFSIEVGAKCDSSETNCNLATRLESNESKTIHDAMISDSDCQSGISQGTNQAITDLSRLPKYDIRSAISDQDDSLIQSPLGDMGVVDFKSKTSINKQSSRGVSGMSTVDNHHHHHDRIQPSEFKSSRLSDQIVGQLGTESQCPGVGFEIISTKAHPSNEGFSNEVHADNFHIYLSDDSNDASNANHDANKCPVDEDTGRDSGMVAKESSMSHATSDMFTNQAIGCENGTSNSSEIIQDCTRREMNSKKRKSCAEDIPEPVQKQERMEGTSQSFEMPKNLDIDQFLSRLKYTL